MDEQRQEQEQQQLERLQRRTNPSGFPWIPLVGAALASGLVFLVVQLGLSAAVMGQSIWAPVRMIGALVLGQGVLPPPATFELGVFLTAVVTHFVLAFIYTTIGSLVVRARGVPIIGALLGLVLYLVNFHVLTAMFPWFAAARGWISVVSHILFGVTAAWTYVELRRRREPITPTPAGIDESREPAGVSE